MKRWIKDPLPLAELREMALAVSGYCLFIAIIFSVTAYLTQPASPPIPRLIAHNCPGAGGDLWAMEEDDFPFGCQQIERNQ